jgi:hypothetical protein
MPLEAIVAKADTDTLAKYDSGPVSNKCVNRELEHPSLTCI